MLDDLEPQAAAHVGQLVFAFARLDFTLALAIRNLIPSTSPSDLDPMIERLGFKERLDFLRDMVARSTTLSRTAVERFEVCYLAADRLRATRNAFVHGRWGMQSRDTVFNASTKVGKALAGDAKIYTIADLEAEAMLAKQVLRDFHDWHYQHVVSAA